MRLKYQYIQIAFLALPLGLSACLGEGGRESTDSMLLAEQRDDSLESYPLLGSKRAAHVWEEFCATQSDDALLPPDPRSLIRPGVNQGKAVFFNAYWEDCHVNLPEQEKQANTCGEYRQRRDRGQHFLIEELPVSAMSAEDFNNSWQTWGYEQRPENFEELYTLRYGLNLAPFHNPYPLPGEDPATSDGGSGQLPLGLRQLKDDSGNWTGQIGSAACFSCHGGQAGDPYNNEGMHIGLKNLGSGNNNYDVLMAGRDGSQFNGTVLSDLLPPFDINTVFNIGVKQRGQNNAVGAFEFLVTLLDNNSLGVNPNPLKNMVSDGDLQGVIDLAHPLAHTQDTPPWWNMSVRPRKFFDAGVSNDSTRIIMAAGPGELNEILSQDGKPYRSRIEEWDQDLEAFFLSLESPAYPGEIDETLAKQGAVLFHAKDLWAAAENANAPKPLGGNGSCASCHGAYSPRFVHDPNYLDDPALEGIGAHISPLEVINTDPARSDMLTPTLRKGWDTTYWGYTDGVDGWVHPDEQDPFTELVDDTYPINLRPQGVCGWEKEVIGYQAPPLYGIWATSPYLHNGSVPTIEQVLDSSQRPTIWQRKIQEDGLVKGFDQSLQRAYDYQRIGWQHDALECSEMPGTQLMNCNPLDDQGPSIVQLAQNYLNSTLSWAGLLTISDPDPDGFDKRLIYDTRILGNGNGGHSFTDALSERERKAIIEYLKTL
ncbi:MAG: putative rubber dioxygenase RoxC [Oceanococcus sp.]